MKFKFSSTTFLVLALAGTSAWYLLYEKRVISERSVKEKKEKLLLSWSPSDIQELEINHLEGQTFKLKRTGADWILTSPVEDAADSATVNSLLGSLTSAEEERVVEEASEKLELFGLDKPSLSIKAFKDVNTFTEVFIGSQTQVGFGAYARVSNRPQILKINRSLFNAFQKSLFELRNKSLVKTPKTDLKELEIQNGTGRFLGLKTSEDKWVIGRESYPTDPTNWNKLLNTVLNLKAKEVASEKPDLTSFGLNQPQIVFTLTTTVDKPKETVMLSQKGDKLFAKNDSIPLVYEVAPEVLADLKLGEKDFRDRHLTQFNRFNVHKITISRSDSQTELTKDGAVWSLKDSKPEQKIDANRIEQFLTQLQDAVVTDFVPSAKIEKASLVIELFEKKEDKDVSVAKIEFWKAGSQYIRGKSSTSPVGWNVSADTFKQLDLSGKDFLEIQETKQPEKKS